MTTQNSPKKTYLTDHPFQRISPQDEHFFFGYYDIPAFDPSGSRHLYHKVSFIDRLPEKADTAEIGLIDISTGCTIPLAETRAWNFQQGSLLRWLSGNEIIHNDFQDNRFVSVIRDTATGKSRTLDLPLAHVSDDGNWGVSINFSRLYDYRPGYGYCNIPDPFASENCPKDDGIIAVDIRQNRSDIILSCAQIWDIIRSFYEKPEKILVNHITFNPSGTRILALIRHKTSGPDLRTMVMTLDRDGSNPYFLNSPGTASHYHWKDERTIAFWMTDPNRTEGATALFEVTDQSQQKDPIDPEFFLKDGHCSYSPDLSRMLYDSYPDNESFRNLWIYDLKNRGGTRLGRFFSLPDLLHNARCDLHPRWNPQGTAISFDSTHEGFRGIYYMEI